MHSGKGEIKVRELTAFTNSWERLHFTTQNFPQPKSVLVQPYMHQGFKTEQYKIDGIFNSEPHK